jgi:LuxR family maltose regulon positive regulatory protein
MDSASLMLISAPSGYGKSLTVSSWVEKENKSFSWFSISEKEANFHRFIREFILALRIHYPGFGEEVLALSRAVESPSPETFGQIVSDELSDLRSRIYLVLDDYHLINNPRVDRFIESLVSNTLPDFKLAIITRQDPSLPLSQWRLKNQLVEIRDRDLMFTRSEIGSFVEKNKGLQLNEEQLLALEKLSEGWISGLRLLLLSLSPDQMLEPAQSPGSLENNSTLFSLLNEFLLIQPHEIRIPLLQLSLLSEFDEEFYSALYLDNAGEYDGMLEFQEFVNHLKMSNLFLIGLDVKGKWYRFHHLFQDLLKGMIPDYFTADEQKDLQLSFANTCKQKSRHEQAIGHYLNAGQNGAAVSVFSGIRKELFSRSSWPDLERIFASFPKELAVQYSILGLTEAWLYIYKGNIPHMESLIDPLSRMIEQDICEEQERIHYMGELEALKAYGRYNLNIDMEACLDHSREALQMLGDYNSYATGLAWVFYGGSMQALGKSDTAREEIYSELEISDDLQVQSSLYLILCYIYWIEGDLRDLRNTASHLIRFGQSHQLREALANGYYFSGIANYYMNRGARSKKALEEFYKLRPFTIMVHQFFGTTALAFLQLTTLDEEKLEDLLLELDTMAVLKGGKIYMDFSKAISSVLRWTKNRDPESLKWAREFNPLPLIPMTNFVALPLLQAYILASSPEKADQLQAAEIIEICEPFLSENHNTLFLIRSRIILTLAYANLHETDKRNETFIKALTMAESRNLAFSIRILDAHLDDMLETCPMTETQREFLVNNVKESSGRGQSPDPKDLLTRRELEILEEVCSSKTNKEIGNKLFISEKTVKRHIANIYQKLQIKNRKEAVRLLSSVQEEVEQTEQFK